MRGRRMTILEVGAVLPELYKFLGGQGNRIRTNDAVVGRALGLSRDSAVAKIRRLLVGLNVLKTENEYGLRDWAIYWTLLVPEAEAQKRLAGHIALGRGLTHYDSMTRMYKKKPKKETPVVTTEAPVVAPETSAEEVRAIAGPDAPKPMEALKAERKDEPRALLEAARQYAGRHAAVLAKLGELEALGIDIDREAAIKAIKLRRDDRLEAVSEVLPYVDRLERQLERQGKQIAETTEGNRGKSALEAEIRALKEANGRLSERNIKLRDQLTTKVVDDVVGVPAN